jgi:hypothetical protein
MSRTNLQLKTATELFHGGRLAEASVLCEALAADGEASSQFLGLFGQLQLLRNRTDAAEPLLVAALAEAPESPRLRALLAETYRRAGRLLVAAELYRDLGRPALAAKLEATGGDWYRLTPPSAPVTLPWLGESGPALIEARVGDGRVGRFLIDTGVGETLLDPHLASAAGVRSFGDEAIHFPAGPAGRVEHGLLSRLALGDLVIEAVPVHVYDTRTAMAGLLPVPVDGVVGTGLLSRLPVALDWARRELRLGDATGGDGGEIGAPFYWAADQYPLVPARLNDRLDTLLFLDTGLSGTAFGLSLSSAQAAEVELVDTTKGVGYGVQHQFQAHALRCQSLSAAGRTRQGLVGMLLQPFRLEHRFGFRIGGLLGDGFVDGRCLWLDFTRMRIAITGPSAV